MTTQAKAKAAAKKTGEQLYKENPNIFKHGGATAENDGADSVSTAVGATPDVSAKGDGEGDHRDLRTREDDADSDEDGLERDENVPVGKAWGESDDIAKLESEKAAETEKWYHCDNLFFHCKVNLSVVLRVVDKYK